MPSKPRTETRDETRDETPPQQPQASHEPAPPAEKGQRSGDQDQEERTDSRGDVIDMSAHIPKGTSTAHEVERNMEAKHNDLGEGIHTTSGTFGDVVSADATDAVGLTPEMNAERTGTDKSDTRSSKGSDGSDDRKEQVIPDPSEVVGERKGLEQDEDK